MLQNSKCNMQNTEFELCISRHCTVISALLYPCFRCQSNLLIFNRRHVLQRSFSSDVSPAMQTMMSNMAIQQLRMIVPLIRLSDDDIQQYIVYRSAATDSVSSDNSFASACDAVVDGADGGTEEEEVVIVTYIERAVCRAWWLLNGRPIDCYLSCNY